MSLPTSRSTTGEDRLFTPAFIARSPLRTSPPSPPTAHIMRPWSGRSADRRGRRPLLIAGALLAALAIAAHTLTPDLAVPIGLRLVLGVAEALFFVAGIAILADLAPPNRAGEELSFNSVALALGLAFGPRRASCCWRSVASRWCGSARRRWRLRRQSWA